MRIIPGKIYKSKWGGRLIKATSTDVFGEFAGIILQDVNGEIIPAAHESFGWVKDSFDLYLPIKKEDCM